jgi:hypothetical protein
MEPFATKMLLSRFIKKRIGIRVLTTDRSSLIKRLMRDVNTALKKRGKPSIKHCYDVWHMVKAITKDLFVARDQLYFLYGRFLYGWFLYGHFLYDNFLYKHFLYSHKKYY